MVPGRTDLLLRFGPHDVGVIENAFYADETGYGVFRPANTLSNDSELYRICAYIAFSEEWHARLKSEKPANASEWDEFRDVYDSDLWTTVDQDGGIRKINGPVFVEGEVTWRPT